MIVLINPQKKTRINEVMITKPPSCISKTMATINKFILIIISFYKNMRAMEMNYFGVKQEIILSNPKIPRNHRVFAKAKIDTCESASIQPFV